MLFRSIVSGMGCKEPERGRGAGAVGSIVSAVIRSASSSTATTDLRAVSTVSIAARTSFAVAPILGRSAGGSSPIPRSTSVIAPRFPRSDEPSSSSAVRSVHSAMRDAASPWRVRSWDSSAARSTASVRFGQTRFATSATALNAIASRTARSARIFRSSATLLRFSPATRTE